MKFGTIQTNPLSGRSSPLVEVFDLVQKKRTTQDDLVTYISNLSPEITFDGPDMYVHQFVTKPHPGSLLKNFSVVFDFTNAGIATLLDTDRKTVANRMKARRDLPTEDVERMTRYMRVYMQAGRLFRTSGGAHRWMTSNSEALGGVSPQSLLKTGEGVRLVLDELGRIEHGLSI